MNNQIPKDIEKFEEEIVTLEEQKIPKTNLKNT